MIEDVESLCLKNQIPFQVFHPQNRQDFFTLFDNLHVAANEGAQPILHFDMHGSKDLGLHLRPSGEFVSWRALIERLQAINVAMKNNLVCFFATCHAYYFKLGIHLKRPTPSYVTIAPSDTVTVDYLERVTLPFYKRIFEQDLGIQEALKQSLEGQMEYYHCQGILLLALAKYIAKYTKGKAKQERLERLLTRALAEGIPNVSISETRKEIRRGLKPGPEIIDQFAPAFLIGREPQFTFEDLTRFSK